MKKIGTGKSKALKDADAEEVDFLCGLVGSNEKERTTLSLRSMYEVRVSGHEVRDSWHEARDSWHEKGESWHEERDSGMKKEIAGMKQEIAGMKQDRAGMKHEIADMKQEVTEMKQEIADMIEARDSWHEVGDSGHEARGSEHEARDSGHKQEKAGMRLEINTLTLDLQCFAISDDDIQFYTGFPSYSTLTSLYEFLLPSATQLNYWGTDNTENHLSTDVKCGPSRKLHPIDEMFLVLYHLKCNVLEK